jgi:hypothetical protein
LSGTGIREAFGRIYRRAPESLRLAILVRRRQRIWLDRGIVFIHIPKAAGTSINTALFDRFMGHARAIDVLRWGSAELQALPRFAVVRNPWERLVSAYRFAKSGAGIGKAAAGMRRPELYRAAEFESFERFVHEWLAPRDVAKLDGVFRQQHPYVSDKQGRLLVHHLGRLEDLGPTCGFIEKAIGRPIEIPRVNLSGQPVDYRQMYTAQTAALVGQIYREDVEKFGYGF